MKKLLFVLGLSISMAHAAPLPTEKIRGMASQIDAVMEDRMCAVMNDTKDYGSKTMLIILPPPTGARRILVNDYNWMRNIGYTKTKGEWDMKLRMIEECEKDGDSGKCISFRSYISSIPAWIRPPGNGVVAK